MNKKILVLGIGNPILRDDAIGFIITEELSKILPGEFFEFRKESVGGWKILDILKDYDTAVILDSVYDNDEVGTLKKVTLEEFSRNVRPASPHDLNLASALELGTKTGYRMPSRLIFFVVSIKPQSVFGEAISEKLKASIEGIVSGIINDDEIKRLSS